MIETNANEMRQLFLQEMAELLQHIEADTLALEANPDESDRIDTLFRYFHTLKGGAGMSGLPILANYTHKVENLLDEIRAGKLAISTALVSALLEASDCLNGFMEEASGLGALDPARIQGSLAQLAHLSGQEPSPIQQTSEPHAPTPPKVATAPPPRKATPEQTFLLQLRFNHDLLVSHTDPLIILQDLETLGSMLVFPHPHDVPPLDQLKPERLHLWWTLILKTTATQKKVQAVLMFFLDDHDVRIESIAGAPGEILNQLAIDSQVTTPLKKGGIAPVAAAPGDLPAPPQQDTADTDKKAVDAPKTDTTPTTDTTPKPDKAPPPPPSPKPQAPAKKPVETYLRVDIHKLDKLINLIGEMVIVHTRLKQSQEGLPLMNEEAGEQFTQVLDDHDRIVQDLHAQAMRVRMIAIGNILFPLKRLVRDYSGQSNKRIQLHISGEDTEVDKTIVDKLSGPLTHLIRNAMDHGIETPEIRQQRGKSPEGTISLTALNRKNAIIIKIADDGAGVDFDRVLTIARERKLIHPGEMPTQEEILHFLFHSGFSTAKKVSEISGRGVGMDVVRKEIEALRGSIRIESTPGQGSLFRIELPLTLAIIEGLLVGVGGRIFVIPLLSIVETLQPRFCQFRTLKQHGELVRIREEYMPLLRLHQIFSIDRAITDPEKGLLILIEESGQKSCLLVDEIIDQQQTVIKSLEQNLTSVEGIAGATIMGDGRISLVLDIPSLIRRTTSD